MDPRADGKIGDDGLNGCQVKPDLRRLKEVEILKPFDRTLNKNFSGRGQAVKAAVHDDTNVYAQ